MPASRDDDDEDDEDPYRASSDLAPEPDIDPRYDTFFKPRYDDVLDPPRPVTHAGPGVQRAAAQLGVERPSGRHRAVEAPSAAGRRPLSAHLPGGKQPEWQGHLRDTSPTGHSTLSAQVGKCLHVHAPAHRCSYTPPVGRLQRAPCPHLAYVPDVYPSAQMRCWRCLYAIGASLRRTGCVALRSPGGPAMHCLYCR